MAQFFAFRAVLLSAVVGRSLDAFGIAAAGTDLELHVAGHHPSLRDRRMLRAVRLPIRLLAASFDRAVFVVFVHIVTVLGSPCLRKCFPWHILPWRNS
jgi:hypothetical protein